MRYYFYPTISAYPNTSLSPILLDFKFTHLLIRTGDAETSLGFDDGLKLVNIISDLVFCITNKDSSKLIYLQLQYPDEFEMVYSSIKRKSTLKIYSLQIEMIDQVLSVRPVSKIKGIQNPILQVRLNEGGQMSDSFNQFIFNVAGDLSTIKSRCVELDNESFLVLDYISWDKTKRIDIEFAHKPNFRSRGNDHIFSIPNTAIPSLQTVLSEMSAQFALDTLAS